MTAKGFPYVAVQKFGSLNLNKNKLGLKPGQLIQNENYLWNSTGQLYERGGGSKLSNAPSAGSKMYGLSNYKNNNSSEFLVTVQGTDAYYYNSGWNALSLTLTSNKVMRFEHAGSGANRKLYGFNGNDSVIAISGSTPSATTVGSSPTGCVMAKLHKNRLFAIDTQDTVYYTEVGAFETWNTGANTFDVFPGVSGYLKAVESWGDALFFFKEDGIYVLPNAADDPSDWKILRTDAMTGTQAPGSVKRTPLGIFFLSTDHFVRKISPSISFSSAEYTLGGSGTPIVSLEIQDDIDELLDPDNVSAAEAVVDRDLYILSFQTVNNSSTYNDRMYAANTRLLTRAGGESVLQPYWSVVTGLDFDYMTVQAVTGIPVLYGVKGDNGETHSAFDDDTHNDNSTAIASKGTLAWLAPGGEGLVKKLKKIRFGGDVQDWAITLKVNAYSDGFVPGEGAGTEYEFRPTQDAATLGSFIVGTDKLGGSGLALSEFRVNQRGRWFSLHFANENADEFTRINNVLMYYRPIRQR